MEPCDSCRGQLITQMREMRTLPWLVTEEKLEPIRKQDKKKLQQLL